MSHLVVMRIVNGAKTVKPWYAKLVPSTTTMSELFSLLRDGEIDGCQVKHLLVFGFNVYFPIRPIF